MLRSPAHSPGVWAQVHSLRYIRRPDDLVWSVFRQCFRAACVAGRSCTELGHFRLRYMTCALPRSGASLRSVRPHTVRSARVQQVFWLSSRQMRATWHVNLVPAQG